MRLSLEHQPTLPNTSLKPGQGWLTILWERHWHGCIYGSYSHSMARCYLEIWKDPECFADQRVLMRRAVIAHRSVEDRLPENERFFTMYFDHKGEPRLEPQQCQ